jgi:hypothetical protein|tara:strand:+ start:145 stop:393 length:249 start_codon:yes stop_codon:yes gene_type:complete
VEKFNELFFGVVTIVAGAFGWIVKNIKTDANDAHKRIDSLERRIVTSEQLENTLKPVRTDLTLIKEHLMNGCPKKNNDYQSR